MGIEIKPGNILDASISPAINSIIIAKSKTMDFNLIFKISNAIPAGGMIKVDLPEEFLIVKDTAYDLVKIVSGI